MGANPLLVAAACAISGCGRLGFETRDRISAVDAKRSDASGAVDDSGAIDGSGDPLPANDLCTNAIDVSNGGTFMGTTCGANNEYDNTCFVAGTPDVWYVVVRGSGGGIINYNLAVTSGFYTKSGTGMCGDSTLTNCRITVIASQANMSWPIVVESETGGCGSFMLQVTIQ